MTADGARRRPLEDVFDAFEARDVTYVVLRGTDWLPGVVSGSDVDVLVEADAFDEAVERCRTSLERRESPIDGLRHVLSVGLDEPLAATNFVLRSPGRALQFVRQSMTHTRFSGDKFVERGFEAGDVGLHLVNHLAYTSTLDGSPVRVDEPVERAMLDRRQSVDGYYVPAAPDELMHLLCRGVFDYDGQFPERYATRCDELLGTVRASDERHDQFRELLAHTFYDADDLVYELVDAGAYDAIRGRLASFSDY